jgi:hypothetical protein
MKHSFSLFLSSLMIPTPHYYMDSSYRVVLIFGFVKRPGFDSKMGKSECAGNRLYILNTHI